MALYKFIAAEFGKSPLEVIIEGDSQQEAVSKLRLRGMTPVRFLGEEDAGKRRFGGGKRPDIYEFTRQLTPLLTANIPLEKALAIISESSADTVQKEFVNGMRQALHEGKRFSEMIRSYGSLFPGYYANLIESGEETGCLPQVAGELNRFMAESKETRDFIISSSIYPAVILGVVVVVSVVLFTVFVPHFAKIFSDMGRELPNSMRLLVGIGDFLFWALIIGIVGGTGAFFALKQYLGLEVLKFHFSKFLLGLPLLGKIITDLEMCKYLRTLAILIGNHVEIIKTVKIAGKIISNPVISAGFEGIDRKLKSGEKLSAALKDNIFVPRSTAAMLRVGEESGQVGEMLANIAGNLEIDTRTRIKRVLSLFEPAVIIFLAVIVLGVVIAIFVAMMEINAISQGGSGI